MPDPNILGASAGIDAGNAADVLAQRIASVSQRGNPSLGSEGAGPAAFDTESAVDQAVADQAFHPSASGKVSWGTPGTPIDFSSYEQMRQTGEMVNNPRAGMSRDEAMRMVADEARASGFDAPYAPDTRSQYERDQPYSNNYASRVSEVQSRRDEFQVNDRAASYRSNDDPAFVAASEEESTAIVASGNAGRSARHGGGGLSFSLGFGLMQTGSAAGHIYDEENRGTYLTPEQQTTASAGLLPGLGTVFGAIGGAAIGNPILGSMIGGGIGGAAQGVIGATDERNQATREAAEKLSAALGETAASVATFRAQIEQTGAPAQQFAQALSTVGSVGTYGPGSVAGIGALTNAFGEYASQDFAAIAQYSSGPLRHGLGNMASTGALGSAGIDSMGFDAAESGDFSGLKVLQQASRDAKGKNDPEVQRLAEMKTVGDNPFYRAALWVGGELTGHNMLTETSNDLDARKAQIATGTDNVAKAQNDLANQFAQIKSDQIVAQSGIGGAEGGISLAAARGGSASQIGAASEVLYGKLGEAKASTQSEIALLQADLADPQRSLGRKPELTARIAQAQAQLTGFDVTEAQQKRSVFDAGFGEEGANFSFHETADILGGASAASMQGGYNRQAEFLSGTAADPRNPLSPTERSGIAESAARMRYSAGLSVFQEQERSVSIGAAGAGAAYSEAQVLGTPMDAYRARLGLVASDQALSGVIGGRLSQDIPFAERQALQVQQATLAGQIAIGPEEARIGAYSAQAGILSDTQAGDRAGFGRSLGVSGNSAFGSSHIFGDDQSRINLFAGAENGSPQGSAQRARFGAARSQAQEAYAEDQDSSLLYRQTQSERVHDFQDEGAFRRSLIAPYMDGPDSNPLTRGNAVLGDLRRDLSGAQAALKATPQTSPAYEQNAQRVEGFQNRIAELEHSRYSEMFSALPESIAGAPGSGIMAGIVPTAAMTSRFTSNPIFGGFGAPAPMPASSTGAIHPGGTAGAFQSGSGAGSIEALLTRIATAIERGGNHTAAPWAGAGAVAATQQRTYNPGRPTF